MSERLVQARQQQARREALGAGLGRIYTPSAPIDNPELFAGRRALLARTRLLLGKAGTTLIVHGELGVGKTSFCNVLLHDLKVQRHECSRSDTFVSIFRNLLAGLGELFVVAERTQSAEGGFDLGWPGPAKVQGKGARGSKMTPVAAAELDLNFLLNRLAQHEGSVGAILLDEFQRMRDDEVRGQLMEVVKGMADRGLHTALVLAGIGTEPRDLVPEVDVGAYGRRNLEFVPIPTLELSEARELVAQRAKLGVKIEKPSLAKVLWVSAGLPCLIHHLMYQAGLAWIARWEGLVVTVKPKIWEKLGVRPREERFNMRGVDVFLKERDVDVALNELVEASRVGDLQSYDHRGDPNFGRRSDIVGFWLAQDQDVSVSYAAERLGINAAIVRDDLESIASRGPLRIDGRGVLRGPASAPYFRSDLRAVHVVRPRWERFLMDDSKVAEMDRDLEAILHELESADDD